MRTRVFYGWWVVLACALIFLYGGGTFYYGFTAFFDPILEEFGWTRAETAAAFSLQSLEAGFLGPLIGLLIDRFGPRKVTFCGVAIAGLGFIWISHVNSLPSFYGAFLFTSVGSSAAFGSAAYAAVASWFMKKRARAMALLSTGFGASGIIAPGLVWLIAQHGWRASLTTVGLGLWAIGIPLSLVIRDRPEQHGHLPDGEDTGSGLAATGVDARVAGGGISARNDAVTQQESQTYVGFTAREALRTQAFWLLTLSSCLGGVSQSALGVHQIPHLTNVGIPVGIAGLAVTGMTVSSIIGRLGFGYLGDFFDKRHLIAAAAVLQAIGVLIFAHIASAWHILPFVLFYGPGYAGPIPVRPALLADYYGTKAFGLIGGLMGIGWTVAGMVGPLFAGWVCDVTGSYRWAFVIFALSTILSIPVVLAVRPPKDAQKRAASPF